MRSFFKISVTNLFLLAFFLSGTEILFGNWLARDRLNQLNLLKNEDLGFDASRLYPGGEAVRYRRDRYGLRGLDGNPAAIDLLTLGGSTTDQRYLTEGATWQDILKESFRRHAKTFVVANAGLDGQSTYGEIKDFELWFPEIPGLKVRYILAYNGINDLFTDSDSANDDLEGQRTWKGALKSCSALYRLYKLLQGSFLAHYRYPVSHRAVSFDRIRWISEPLQKDHRILMAARLESYERNLRELAARIHRLGAVPIFVTQTSRMFRKEGGQIQGAAETVRYEGVPVNGVDLARMLSLMNEKTIAVCEESGGICLDLANDISFEDGDFYDYFHNTPPGARKIGEYLYAKLKDLPQT